MLTIHGSTKFLILFLYVSEICHFLCSSLMRFFCGTSFFIFQDSVWLVKKS